MLSLLNIALEMSVSLICHLRVIQGQMSQGKLKDHICHIQALVTACTLSAILA